jgi:hypothetical protein
MLLEGHSSELVREGREIRRFIKKLEDMRWIGITVLLKKMEKLS